MLSKTIPTYSSCYNDSERVWFDISKTYRFVVIEEKVKCHIFWLYRGQTGKNVPLLLAMVSLPAIQIQNSLLYEACFGNMVTQ